MHDFMTQRVWALAPNAVESFCEQVRQAKTQAYNPFSISEHSAPAYEVVDGVAVLDIRGSLSKRSGWWSTGYEDIRKRMEAALADSAVHTIMLNIDSNGGGVDGLKVLCDWIASVRDEKTLCAYVDGKALSAGYWIAASTGTVYAPVTAEVASIGVLQMHIDWSVFNKEFGIEVTYIHSGKWKVAGNPDSPLSDEDQAYLQTQCDSLYGHFTTDVATSMGLDLAALKTWADGQIFFADKGLELGLVSSVIPGRDELIEQLAKESSPMNRKELKDKHPDLFAEVQQEGRKAGLEEGRKLMIDDAQTIVKALAGDEFADKFAAITDSGVTGKQLEALAPLMGPNAAPAPQQDASQPAEADADKSTREQILGALQTSSPSPVNHAGQPKPDTPDQKRAASIDRMKQIARR